jgi:hypothetical protein
MSPTDQRPIPPVPGGGSWTFNETTWEWESNHPVPEDQPAVQTAEAPQPAADPFHAEE